MWKYVLIGWNVWVFILYGMDKLFAVCGRRRIPEKTLIGAAYFMGAGGAFVGMILFRHKIRKWCFRICIPLAIVINLALLYLFFHVLV